MAVLSCGGYIPDSQCSLVCSVVSKADCHAFASASRSLAHATVAWWAFLAISSNSRAATARRFALVSAFSAALTSSGTFSAACLAVFVFSSALMAVIPAKFAIVSKWSAVAASSAWSPARGLGFGRWISLACGGSLVDRGEFGRDLLSCGETLADRGDLDRDLFFRA